MNQELLRIESEHVRDEFARLRRLNKVSEYALSEAVTQIMELVVQGNPSRSETHAEWVDHFYALAQRKLDEAGGVLDDVPYANPLDEAILAAIGLRWQTAAQIAKAVGTDPKIVAARIRLLSDRGFPIERLGGAVLEYRLGELGDAKA